MGKKIASYIITFLFIVLLMVSILLTVLSQTILKEKYMLKVLEKNNYYAETYQDILETFKNNTIQSGLEDTVLDGIMTEEQVEAEVKSLVAYIYNGTEMKIDTEGVKTRLQQNIDAVVAQNNKKVTEEEKGAIATYVNTIGKIYGDGIAFAQGYISEIHNVIEKVQGIMQTAKIVAYIITIVVAMVLFVINKKESLKYLSIACISTGLLCIIIKIVEVSTMKVQNILILTKAFSNVLIHTIQSIMLNLLIIRNCILYFRFSIECHKQ